MKMIPTVAAALISSAAFAADDLKPITPQATTYAVGVAGESPPAIARFLLAAGPIDAAISPDGAHVALIRDVTGVRQLWVAGATGGQPQQLTFGAGVRFFAWAPDGGSLVYGADNNGDERENYYVISVDGDEERLLLPAVENGFREFGAFSPDGASFAFTSTERNGSDFDIYVADLDTGLVRMVREGELHYSVHAWTRDDKLIVSESVGEDANNLFTVDAETGEIEMLYAPEEPANYTSGFASGGDRVVVGPDDALYFSTNAGREFTALGRHDLATGAFDVIDQGEGDREQPTLCGGRYLAYTVHRDGHDVLKVRDLAKKAKEVAAPALLEGVLRLSCATDAARLAIRAEGYDRPGDVIVWDVGAKSTRTVFAGNLAGLDAASLSKPQALKIKARDGVMLQGLLYLPAGVEKPPVIFDVHGGPTGESIADFEAETQLHVSRGFAVLQTNVRGSTGFGRTYMNLDNREKRLDSVRDLVDMLEFLRADGRVDADRAVVRGGSYGGYVVNAVLGAYPDAFAAGIALYGVGDWVSALEVASPALKASDLIEYGDIGEPKWRDFYTENSPIRLAGRIRAPVLYSHGAMDPRIDKAETELMVRALRKNGVDAPYILFPDEGHGWRKLSNRLFYYDQEIRFIEQVFQAD